VHIPDGFIAPQVYLPAAAAAGGGWFYGLRRLRSHLDERALPRLAVTTGLAFGLMSLSVPLPGGTSVHAMGIGLLALTFGVWTAFLSMSLVLLLQAVMFGEGGITTLPVNALAMGLAGSAAACLVHGALRRVHREAAVFAGAFAGVMTAALVLAVVLGLQPVLAHRPDGTPLFFPFGLRVTLPAVLIPHAVVGVGEGALTLLVLRFLGRLDGAPRAQRTGADHAGAGASSEQKS
jgi:cobalt/nickel transport system permease protein